MSIRDELARIVAVSMAETNPSGIRAFDELSSHQRRQLLSRGRHAADSILARYAVVELPEPSRVVVVGARIETLGQSAHVHIEVPNDLVDGQSIRSLNRPENLRALAAAVLVAAMRDEALLAAANRAEAQS